MFGIDSSEFLLIAVVALLVIGPKDLPRVMRLVGGWVGRGRAMTRHLRSGFDTMMREAELEEMQKQWAQQNADIVAATTVAHPFDPAAAGAAFDPAAAGAAFDAAAGPPHGDMIDAPRFRPGQSPEGDAPSAAGAAIMTGPQPAPHALADPVRPAYPPPPYE